MTPRQTWVHLLVWRPVEPAQPFDVSRAWPRVLQVSGAAGTPAPPGVILRPDESIRAAAGRIATALGLRPPTLPRVLAVDQRPAEGDFPEELSLIVDGGWLADDVPVACTCGQHPWSWTPVAELGRLALVHALRGLVVGQPPPALWNGTPFRLATDPDSVPEPAPDPDPGRRPSS
ncbi:NUDIX hydrolase [Streptomyces buecherae]|uniref:hypothetical protein n=1 Tax=Streptomyces buecherae TaxID=2763006 RepID=UPI0036630B75